MPAGVTGLAATLTASGLMILDGRLSVLVTAHVLLRQRDIGVAIGWIWFSWLSPFLGSSLYYPLGINRVRQRARTLNRPNLDWAENNTQHPIHCQGSVLEAIDRTGHRLSRRRAAAGNSVVLLRNG